VRSLHRTALSEKYFRDLPTHHQQLLTGFSDHLAVIRTCIEHNFAIIKLLIADTDHMFENRLDYFNTVSILLPSLSNLCYCVHAFGLSQKWLIAGMLTLGWCIFPVLAMFVVVFALQNGAVYSASEFDMDKVKSTLKQIVRDWSLEGKAERTSCYKPVIDTIIRLFPSSQWSVYLPT